jgi:RNA polymerase sigma factor (sigma-70 family)
MSHTSTFRLRDEGAQRDPDAATSSELLQRARDGDCAALDLLLSRQLPALTRWASGRLPPWSRNGMDTLDLVQETMLGLLKHVDRFESRGQGALGAYLRQAIVNRVKDQKRNATRRPRVTALDSAIRDEAPSPMDHAISEEARKRYGAALQRLQSDERQAVIARLEFGHDYQEIAWLMNKPSRDAARMFVARALIKLAHEMELDEQG